MLHTFENCSNACPYWLSTIRALRLPTLRSAEIPVSARALIQDIVAAVQENRLPAAATSIDKARELVEPSSPSHAFLQVASAAIHLGGGNLAAARQSLDRIAAVHANDPAVRHSRGVVEVQEKRFPEAVASFQASVAADPANAAGWAALAVIHALERDHPATENAARQALRLGDQHFGLVPLALMQATYFQGKPVEGAMDFSSLGDDGEAVVDRCLADFPPVDVAELVHPGETRPIYFVYADHAYVIEHAIPLILSLKETGAQAAVHLHVANPGNGLRRILDRLRTTLGEMPLVVSGESVVVEQYAVPAVYHSCIRFVRMYQLLRVNDAPVVMLDADVLVRRDPVRLVHEGPIDVVVSRSPHDPFWSTYYGGYVEVHPTAGGRAYMGQVSAFILDNIRKGVARWFLDQTALAACADKYATVAAIGTLPKSACGAGQFTGGETFWTAVNQDKYADNDHTREKTRIREKFGFQPVALEPRPEAQLVERPSGRMVLPKNDSPLARALRTPEGYRHRELGLLSELVRPGATVVEAWANAGGMTIPLAARLGPRGRLFAFEPDGFLCRLLETNVTINGLHNVFAEQRRCVAESDALHAERRRFDDDREPLAIDALGLDACHLMCLDAGDAEAGVLHGADATIRRFHPVFYVTTRSRVLLPKTRVLLESLGYRVYLNSPDPAVSAFLGLPAESRVQVSGMQQVPLHA